MVGIINIIGLIGSFNDQNGIELIDVIQQVKAQPEATSFEININSAGGVVEVGFEIYDYLKSINLPKTTVAYKMCASIATVFFMAGDTRIIENGCQFMIHLPMVKSFDYMNTEDLTNFTEGLKLVEKRIINFYEKTTKLNSSELNPLLKNESWLNESQAFDFGFTTQRTESLKAVAYFINPSTNKNNNKMPEQNLSTESKNWLETKLNALQKVLKFQKL